MNSFKTALLLAAMTALFMAVGFVVGGTTGMIIAFGVAAAMNIFSYWNSGKMVLSMQGAREVDATSAPTLYRIVEDLAHNADMPMPRVYVIHQDQPNAFATGRNPENAAVAATTGLLQMLNKREIAGVMAHELAHVKNYDTLTMTVTATIAGAISMLGNFALFFRSDRNGAFGLIGAIAAMILAPLGAMLVQSAISRTREYSADRLGAEISGDPLALASALQKISDYAHQIRNPVAEANPATAHLFIINPLRGVRFDTLFSTHPSTRSRIEALQQLADESRQSGYQRQPSRTISDTPRPGKGPWSKVTKRKGPWG